MIRGTPEWQERLFSKSALHLGPQPSGRSADHKPKGGRGGASSRPASTDDPRKKLDELAVACDCGERCRIFPAQAVRDGDCRWQCVACRSDEEREQMKRARDLRRAAYRRDWRRRRQEAA